MRHALPYASAYSNPPITDRPTLQDLPWLAWPLLCRCRTLDCSAWPGIPTPTGPPPASSQRLPLLPLARCRLSWRVRGARAAWRWSSAAWTSFPSPRCRRAWGSVVSGGAGHEAGGCARCGHLLRHAGWTEHGMVLRLVWRGALTWTSWGHQLPPWVPRKTNPAGLPEGPGRRAGLSRHPGGAWLGVRTAQQTGRCRPAPGSCRHSVARQSADRQVVGWSAPRLLL